MRKLLKYTKSPYEEWEITADEPTWVGGGWQGVIAADAIIGIEPSEPCDKGPRTALYLITGKALHVMGTVDEWIQKMIGLGWEIMEIDT